MSRFIIGFSGRQRTPPEHTLIMADIISHEEKQHLQKAFSYIRTKFMCVSRMDIYEMVLLYSRIMVLIRSINDTMLIFIVGRILDLKSLKLYA